MDVDISIIQLKPAVKVSRN